MAEGGVPLEEESLPTLQDFLNNERLRTLYQDPEVQMIFTEIENNPSTIHQHHNKSKVQEVLKLIQAEFDRHQPSRIHAENIHTPDHQHTTRSDSYNGYINDDDDIEDILQQIKQQENQAAGNS